MRMRTNHRIAGAVVVGALALIAGALVAGDALAAGPTPVPASAGAAGAHRLSNPLAQRAEDPEPLPDSLKRYRLSPQALQGLPTALELQQLRKRFGAGQGPTGIQYFESQAGLFGMFFHRGDGLQPKPLLFFLRNGWAFLPGQGFEQLDSLGNRLVVEDGKARIFNGAHVQIGALQDPSLGLLYRELLRLTM